MFRCNRLSGPSSISIGPGMKGNGLAGKLAMVAGLQDDARKDESRVTGGTMGATGEGKLVGGLGRHTSAKE